MKRFKEEKKGTVKIGKNFVLESEVGSGGFGREGIMGKTKNMRNT